MKIVIAGGNHEADYIIGMYKNGNNELIVINGNYETCRYLSEKNGIQVINADPSKPNQLKDADCENADLLIALSDDDINNYVVCKTAKKLLNIKKCIAIVSNPKKVSTFKKLGVDSVISSTYLLAEQIKNESSIEDLIKTLTLEDNKIVIFEVTISENNRVCDKKLSELNMSSYASISCVYRAEKAIIPNGDTVLMPGDKVLTVTTKEYEDKAIAVFKEII